MKRNITIYYSDDTQQSFEIEHLYNPQIWTAYTVIHFTTIHGKSYSIMTAGDENRAGIIKIEVEKKL